MIEPLFTCRRVASAGASMNSPRVLRVLKGSLILTLAVLASACIVAEPREGYYDRDHGRFYHEHAWHDCGEHNDSCR